MLLGCKLRHEFGFVRLFSHEETGPVQRHVRDKAVAPRCRHLNGDWTQWSQNRVLRPLRSLSAWALAWSWRASSSISSPASSASSCRGSWARPRSTPCTGPLKLPALGPKTGSCGTKKFCTMPAPRVLAARLWPKHAVCPRGWPQSEPPVTLQGSELCSMSSESALWRHCDGFASPGRACLSVLAGGHNRFQIAGEWPQPVSHNVGV